MKRMFIRRTAVLEAIVLLLVIVLPILVNKVEAANFQQAYVRLDRISDVTTTGGTVCARPATANTESDVQVTFPTVAGTDFTVNSTATNWVVDDTNLPTGSTFWIGMTSGVTDADSVSGKTVTFPSGDLVVGTMYCFHFTGTSTLTTGALGNDQVGTITTRTSGAATIDSSSYALSVIANDQLVISATVPPTFSVVFGDGADADADANTDSFTGNLSTTTTSTYGNTLTVATNAQDGWIAWVKSANAALNSTVASASIATAGTVNGAPSDLASLTGYVLDVDETTETCSGSSNLVIDPEYLGANTTSGGTLSTSFQPIASCDGVASGDVLTLIERAKISAVQAAASDYTDTLTIVAAGRF